MKNHLALAMQQSNCIALCTDAHTHAHI